MSPIAAIDEAPSILLVEDNPGDVRLVEELLRAAWVVAGSINHVSSVEDAIGHVAKDVPACILLDLSLPDAQGLGTLERVRDAHPSVPIVVLTGTDDEAQAVQAVQEGAQDYLIKGQVDGHLLGRAIRYAIERKFAEVQLSHQALHDPLTGLANRALLMERLAQALARTERRPSSVAVLFLDIDRFKTINDNFGHEVGDSVLACIGDRLRKALRRPTRGHDRRAHREVDLGTNLFGGGGGRGHDEHRDRRGKGNRRSTRGAPAGCRRGGIPGEGAREGPVRVL
jgi:PleD family two-component response regulator